MDIISTYGVKMKEYNCIFKDTIALYRNAVDFFIGVCLSEWESLSLIKGDNFKQRYIEILCHATANNLNPIYPSFDKDFYKFPSYLRRSAILDAVGKVSSHKSKLAKWENGDPGSRGKKPSHPKAGKTYPCMYKGEMYRRSGEYEAKLKVFARNTWDWITVKLKKSDVDYINRHCKSRKAGFKSYSMCQFLSGKIYNCDLNATYNIGARYFIREILKSLPVRVRLELEAKVPRVSKRSTCTLSTLINLNAELASFAM